MFEPMETGLSNMPDYDNIEDEAFPPLPPPFSPGEGGDPNTHGEESGEISKLADVPTAKRRGVKRPQPKLDSQRLISERGLPALRTLFDNVHLKGPGHEVDNLRVVMQKMENWAHRLYPKLQFEDFIDRLETLGGKKEVQTCLKRIRLDMPLLHEDFIGNDDEDGGSASREEHVFNQDEQDPFGGFPDNSTRLVPSTPATPSLSSETGPVHSTPAPSLTEEQRRRMELNKQLALERRLARMKQHTDGSQSQQISSSQSVDGPSSSQSVDGPSSSQSVDGPSSSQSVDGPSSSQSVDGPSSSQSVDAPSTRVASLYNQPPKDMDDLDQGTKAPEGNMEADHPTDSAPKTASSLESDSISPDSPLCGEAESSSQNPVPDTGSQSNTQNPVPDTSSQSNTQNPVPDTSSQSNTQNPVPDTGSQSNTQNPVPDTSSQSNTQNPVPDTSSQSNTQNPVPYTGSQSSTQNPVLDTCNQSSTQNPVPDMSNGIN